MPRYDFRCRACGDTFELTRPMTAAADPAACPAGHTETVKLIPAVALAGGSAGARPAPPTGGGGCCGGGSCGCR